MAKIDQDNIDAILKKSRMATQADIDSLNVSLEEIDSFGNDESIKEMHASMDNYRQLLNEKITFINDALTTAIPFTRENLYLMCAYSGNGKSTAAANISYPLWLQKKKVLVIANEESKDDVLGRIACLHLGYTFNDMKKGIMPDDMHDQVKSLFSDIAEYVKVLDVQFKDSFTTKLECVQNAMDSVANADYACVLIDFFQRVGQSQISPKTDRFTIMHNFKDYLTNYIKKANLPVVLFAQLHSIGKRNNKDLDSRIKDCPKIYEAATAVMEIIPKFEDSTSQFLIHKDRFGCAGQKLTCGFENGRYVILTDEFKARALDRKLSKLSNDNTDEDDDL